MTTPQKWMLFGVVKVFVLVVAFGVIYSMYGCNTVHGIGQDVKKAGEAIERAGNK
jgi:predicted small secreted protein